jgi:hypothetical protein
MSFYLSAGVYVKETDVSNITPALATTIAAMVGYAKKGSLDKIRVTNRQQFIQEYGTPSIDNYFHYTALAFLENGTQLWCKRVVDVHTAKYAGMNIKASGSASDNEGLHDGRSIPDVTNPLILPIFSNEASISDELFQIFAKDPGVWGDRLSVIIGSVKTTVDPLKPTVSLSETEQYTFVLDVYLTDDFGTASKVESWKVSRKTKVDGYGKQLNLEERINGYSSYILVADDTTQADTIVPKANSTAVLFTGGADGDVPSANDIAGDTVTTGWYAFSSAEEIDIRILIGGGFPASFDDGDLVIIHTAMKTIAESRKDCFAILDIPNSAAGDPLSVTNTETFRDITQNFDTSYAALYSPWVTINDPWNDVLVDVPPSGYVASMYAYNDYVAESWFAPAGFTRGMLNVQSVTKIYNQSERDILYADGVNPIQFFRGQGIPIWGQKTLQRKASALDRVNVRRLMIFLEKTLTIALRPFLFEPNDELTRFRVTGVCTEFLDSQSAKRAFQITSTDPGFQVICDLTNNTPQVIDANELRVDIFVRPVRSAEFIRLQTIITTTGASFTELVSRGILA